MADYWIKWYHEILDDPKMATLPDRLWRRFAELCLLAGKLCPDKSGKLPDARQIAWMLRMPTDDLQLDLEQLASTGLIEPIPGGWFIVNFQKRQHAASSTERVQRHRERQKKQQYYGDETQMKRNVTQINRLTEQNRLRAQGDGETPIFPPAGDEEIGSPLSDKFIELTGILPHDNEKWVEADQTMTRAGVTPDELKVALDKMDADELSYSGLWSVTKTAIWVHSRRQAGKPIFTTQPKKNSMYGDGTGLLNGV
jgi:hypothetical protein